MKMNNDLRKLNDVGKRIAWCREQLRLSKKEVSQETGILFSSYANREYGVRTYYHEEYLALANFFNSRWKERFQISFPLYGGNPISKVSVVWLLFGELND